MRWLSLPLVFVLAAGAAWWFWPTVADERVGAGAGGLASADLIAALAAMPDASAPAGQVPDRGAPLRFPLDHGPHPAAQAEVWDLSARVRDTEGREYGLRLTLLRLELGLGLGQGAATGVMPVRDSGFAASDVLAARLVAVLPGRATPLLDQRVSRAALGLAGSERLAADDRPDIGADAGAGNGVATASAVWIGDWRLARAADGAIDWQAASDDLTMALTLTPLKTPVTTEESGLFDGAGAGQEGAGQRADEPAGDLRLYLEPRLAVTGELGIDGEVRRISGLAQLEHGWGALSGLADGGRGQLAVNRFTLQLDDGTDLACVHLRRRAGGGTPIPTCLVIAADGGRQVLRRRDLTLAPDAVSRSGPQSGLPLRWRLAIPALELDLALTPLVGPAAGGNGPAAGQLIDGLWSGLVDIAGQRGTAPIAGSGRMDLGGYDSEF